MKQWLDQLVREERREKGKVTALNRPEEEGPEQEMGRD